jgi:hypothetical protein
MLLPVDREPHEGRAGAERIQRAVVIGLERAVLVTGLAAVALIFFRPTRRVGRVLIHVWLAVAWPVAWIWRAVGRLAPGDDSGAPRPTSF